MLILPRAPSVIFLFGLAASGKNFVGDLIHRRAGWEVYHADSDLTPEMRDACRQGKPFTDEMRDRYFGVVASRINQLLEKCPNLVVTQGAYKRRHREFLERNVHGLQCVLVVADDALRLERLSKRGDLITPEYEAKIRVFFEPPDDSTPRIVNNADCEAVECQLQKLFG